MSDKSNSGKGLFCLMVWAYSRLCPRSHSSKRARQRSHCVHSQGNRERIALNLPSPSFPCQDSNHPHLIWAFPTSVKLFWKHPKVTNISMVTLSPVRLTWRLKRPELQGLLCLSSGTPALSGLRGWIASAVAGMLEQCRQRRIIMLPFPTSGQTE